MAKEENEHRNQGRQEVAGKSPSPGNHGKSVSPRLLSGLQGMGVVVMTGISLLREELQCADRG